MPFKSEAQRRYMHAKHPQMAERWEQETPSGARLPRKLKEKNNKGKSRRSRNEE